MQIDREAYPTLASKNPSQVEDAVKALIQDGLAENELQALQNLEQDLMMDEMESLGKN